MRRGGWYTATLMKRGMPRHASRIAAATVCATITAWATGCTRPVPVPAAAPIERVMILVFDQMRPDYIDRFSLEHFKHLRAISRNYPDAYVGHMGAQTVVSHIVIPSGLQPKMLPWQDEAFLDRDGALGKPDTAYRTDELGRERLWGLLSGIPADQFLATRLRKKLGGGVYAAGEKDYAATLFGTHADAMVTLKKTAGRCEPDGANVPAYITSNSRFSLECSEPYGTNLSTIWALDGNHYVPGHDPAHLGGDVWTADVALEFMAHEQWSALFLTFGGIDKVGHMLGEQDGHGITSVPSAYHLVDVLHTADEQLGRLLAALEQRHLLDKTLFIVTADHGGQHDEVYMGNGRYQSCCPLEGSSVKADPPYWIEHLTALGGVKTAYVDTSVKLWLSDRSPATEQRLVRGLSDIPGMIEVYARRSGDEATIARVFSRLDVQPTPFQNWAQRHNAELVQTMMSTTGPDLVGLLADGYGFGRVGDHGGAQEKVQRIPMIIYVPGQPPKTITTPMRLVDINAEVTSLAGLEPAPRVVPAMR
jgi:hypothetical protein